MLSRTLNHHHHHHCSSIFVASSSSCCCSGFWLCSSLSAASLSLAADSTTAANFRGSERALLSAWFLNANQHQRREGLKKAFQRDPSLQLRRSLVLCFPLLRLRFQVPTSEARQPSRLGINSAQLFAPKLNCQQTSASAHPSPAAEAESKPCSNSGSGRGRSRGRKAAVKAGATPPMPATMLSRSLQQLELEASSLAGLKAPNGMLKIMASETARNDLSII